MSKTPMGGLDALVAAASAAGQASGSQKRKRDDEGDTASALFSLFTNPIFVSALAASTAASNPPDHLHATFQQTRSGRISRPPAAPTHNLLQALTAELESGSGNFDELLKSLSTKAPPVIDPSLTGASSSSDFTGYGPNVTTPNAALDWNETLASATGQRESITPEHSQDGDLPAWPLPPGGPGGRKNMPKEEMLARRRARNRLAAVESRKRRKNHMEGIEGKLKEKEVAYQILQLHCKNLENQIAQLQQVIRNAGLAELPMEPIPPDPIPPAPIQPVPINDTPASFASFDESLPPLEMFFNIDEDGDDDGDFLPPSSPANSDDERKKTKGKAKNQEDDEEFEDEDVEDEDLFLPIEDVPIPPQMEGAMKSLGVDSQEQLATLINKLVTAGKEGMTSEMVDKLKVLLKMVGPN